MCSRSKTVAGHLSLFHTAPCAILDDLATYTQPTLCTESDLCKDSLQRGGKTCDMVVDADRALVLSFQLARDRFQLLFRFVALLDRLMPPACGVPVHPEMLWH